MVEMCLCDSGKEFEECCGPIIKGDKPAQSAEELMRSRYSAYVLKDGQYLYDTCSNQLKNVDDIEGIKTQSIQWLGLKVIQSSSNEVTFMAYYKEQNNLGVMKESSQFIMEDGAWKYDSGQMLDAQIARNEPCPCGSGKKYKKCCGK